MNVTVEKRMDGWNVACDELIIPLWKGEEIAAAYPELDQRFDGGLAAMQADKEFSGEAKTVAIVHTMGKLAAKKLIIARHGQSRVV